MEGPIRYPESQEIILTVARERQLGDERVSLEDSPGRVLAEKLTSPENVPAFDNSAMDGFAVLGEETSSAAPEAPVSLKVLGLIAAGDLISALAPLESGSCYEIMTGAPVPKGANAIVKIEDTVRAGGASVRVFRPARSGDHIRRAGEDFRIGAPVLNSGSRITAHDLLSLGALGITGAAVRRKPRVALIPTGKELVDIAQQSLAPGQIRNSTGLFLKQALQSSGCEVRSAPVIHDNPEEFKAALDRLVREYRPDVVLTTGAVSMGKFDFVRPALEELGAHVLFHKVAIRPGKPVLMSELSRYGQSTIFFGLPGNPVSTAVGLRFFVEPYLRGIQGLPPERLHSGILKAACRKPEGLRCFYKARVETADSGRTEIEILSGQASFMVSPLTTANAWAILPEDQAEVAVGSVLHWVAL